MAEARLVVFWATCGVTFISRNFATCSATSKALSAPSVIRPHPGTSPTMASAASRSAVPVACVVSVSTTGPLRFSISRWPMWQSLDACPRALRWSRASGSVVEACVALLRRSPRKPRSPLRPGPGGSSPPPLGRPEALHAGPGLDQGAIDGEVLGREVSLHGRVDQDGAQEDAGDIAPEQPLAVLGEHR